MLTCAFLEGGHTYRGLAAGNGVPKSTCYAYIREGIKVLARRALPLTKVVRLAVKAGWAHLIVDGVNVATERVAVQTLQHMIRDPFRTARTVAAS